MRGTVKGRTLKLKKKKTWEFQMFRISFVYLLSYVPYIQNFKKIHACEAADGAKLG